MELLNTRRVIGALALSFFLIPSAWAEPEPACVENSPERQGETGCSLVETKPLPPALKQPLFWHIDRFDTEESARAAVGPASVALEAHGAWWLLSIESSVTDHHGGRHVTNVFLPPLPPAQRYSMLVMSAFIPPGLTSRAHRHSGVEALYTVDGEQCLETSTGAEKIPKGKTLAVPANVTMRLVATGSTPRRTLSVIVYDSSKPPTTEAGSAKLAACH